MLRLFCILIYDPNKIRLLLIILINGFLCKEFASKLKLSSIEVLIIFAKSKLILFLNNYIKKYWWMRKTKHTVDITTVIDYHLISFLIFLIHYFHRRIKQKKKAPLFTLSASITLITVSFSFYPFSMYPISIYFHSSQK